jgi:hypothetical protein
MEWAEKCNLKTSVKTGFNYRHWQNFDWAQFRKYQAQKDDCRFIKKPVP